jgi:hypothetical protein
VDRASRVPARPGFFDLIADRGRGGIVAIFCLADQTRWQPWVFQYSFLLAAIAIGLADRKGHAGEERALDLCRLIVGFTYIFSGLQKINANFMFVEFPWVIEPLTKWIPASARLVPPLGAFAPFLQVAFGIGLLTRRWRPLSLAAAVGMHLFILAMFGPFGQDWNDIVWPWTAAMAVFDVILFSGTSEFTWLELISNRADPARLAGLILFAALPALSFVNLWDSYLSAALYSGNLTEAEIYISDSGMASVAAAIRKQLVHTSANTNVLNIQRWAMEDLNVMPYPETRAYKEVGRQVCRQMQAAGQLVLIIREQRMLRSHAEAGLRCAELH